MSECVRHVCQDLCTDLYLRVCVHVCVVCDTSSLLSPQHDSLFLLPFLSVLHSPLISVGLLLEQLPLFLQFLYFSVHSFLFTGSYHTARRMWKPSYSMTHSTVSQSPPGDGDQDGVGEAGRDKDRIEKLGSGSPGLPAARLLFQRCGEQSMPFHCFLQWQLGLTHLPWG